MNRALTELVSNTLYEIATTTPGGVLALSLEYWAVGKLDALDLKLGHFTGCNVSRPAHIVIGEDDASNMWRTMPEALDACMPHGIVFLMVSGEWSPDVNGFLQIKHYYSGDRMTHLFAGIRASQ